MDDGKTYFVTYQITARFVASVDAKTLGEALKSAHGRFFDADFGEAEDIDGTPVTVEDEDGNIIWEK